MIDVHLVRIGMALLGFALLTALIVFLRYQKVSLTSKHEDLECPVSKDKMAEMRRKVQELKSHEYEVKMKALVWFRENFDGKSLK